MAATTGICAPQPTILPDADALAAAAAEQWIASCREAAAARGVFHVALAGGSTPQRLYRLLAQQANRTRIDWTRVQLYFGDERAVPAEHADSNFRMVRETLLDHVPVAAQQVHRMAALPERIEDAADDYAALLHERLPCDAAGVPVFDLILLGMGADGHTCSLFPDTPILDERARSVAPVYVARLGSWRLSLTYPVLEAAHRLLFLVSGADKAARLRAVCRGAQPPAPVQRIRARGRVDWLVDRAAAAELAA